MRRRGWDLALAASILCVVLPIVATRYLPFTDAPEHAAVMATLRHLGDPAYGAPYELNLLRSQYLAYHALGALLTLVTGDDAELANRLLLAVTGVLFPLSFRFLLRATSRDERLALFACLPFWSRSLVVGFLPFVASIPIAFFMIGVFARSIRRREVAVSRCTTDAAATPATPTPDAPDASDATDATPATDAPRDAPRHWRRQAVLALTALLLFYTHVSTWLLATAIVMVTAFIAKAPCVGSGSGSRSPVGLGRQNPRALSWRAPSPWRAPLFWRASSRVVGSLLPLLPSAVAGVLWLALGKLTLSEGHSLASAGEVHRMSIGRSMLLMPRWIFDVWRGHGDELAAIAWWFAFLLVAIASVRSIRRLNRGALVFLYAPFTTALVVYLATPWRVGAGAMLNVRLAPVLVLFALLPTRLSRGKKRVWEGSIALALVLFANIVGGITAFRECRRAREELGDFDGLLAAIPKGKRVVTLTSDLRSPSTHIYPWFHVGSYHRVRNGGIASFSFTELQHWPLHYVPGSSRPPRKEHATWDFEPCTYRNTIDGEFYDFVLLHGPLDPFAPNPTPPPGPIYRPVFKTANLVLMKKSVDEERVPLIEPDLGPCAEKKTNEPKKDPL